MLVFLDFFDTAANVSLPFPFAGTWQKEIDGRAKPS